MLSLGGGPIVWISKLQTSVAISIAEAEFVALSEAGKTMWISNILKKILKLEKILKMEQIIEIKCDIQQFAIYSPPYILRTH